MSSVPVHAVPRRQAAAAAAPDRAPTAGPADAREHRRPLGGALRAVKVFAAAAFSVVVMGEYAGG
ncbi:hypothetical protein K2224_09575 [Streptomyces sp. BHT-5-2]|nr:hypothetical protein K2224_09575 [Streptomyces sp. BHT-5-2]